jgi:phage gpG-like protein
MLRLSANSGLPGVTALKSRLNDRAALLQALAGPALEIIRDNFLSGGRPRWRPLSEATRRQRGPGARPLIESGRLMGSVRAGLRGDKLVLSTSLPYAAVHQFGGRGIPARPYLALPRSEVARLVRLLARHLSGGQAR